jgi:hypothetical protein
VRNETGRRIREIRESLNELRDPGAHDGPGHDLFLILQRSFQDDLAELGEPAIPDATPLRPRITIRTAVPTKPVVAAMKPTEPETAIGVAEEIPMPRMRKTPDELAAARREYKRRWEAKKKGLPSATVRSESCRQKECPGCLECNPPEGASFDRKTASQVSPMLRESSSAAFRLRALRSQALDLLPCLEDLDFEASVRAADEMDLLAKTLVLGGELIRRSSTPSSTPQRDGL